MYHNSNRKKGKKNNNTNRTGPYGLIPGFLSDWYLKLLSALIFHPYFFLSIRDLISFCIYLIRYTNLTCRMFLEAVKRLRIMRTLDANGLGRSVHFGKVSSKPSAILI